ncbi:MAG: hypothetical protein QXO76_01130 [Thermoproteota archaeon]
MSVSVRLIDDIVSVDVPSLYTRTVLQLNDPILVFPKSTELGDTDIMGLPHAFPDIVSVMRNTKASNLITPTITLLPHRVIKLNLLL